MKAYSRRPYCSKAQNLDKKWSYTNSQRIAVRRIDVGALEATCVPFAPDCNISNPRIELALP
jgi:hypothetical protein